MKRKKFVMIIVFCLVFSMIPATAFASGESRSLVAFPWYYVDSVEEDGETLNIRKDYGWNPEELNCVEVTHAMVVAEKITTNGSTIYKAVSGAKSDNSHLKITESKREHNFSGGQYDLTTYSLEPDELGTYSVSYDGMHAEVEVILPVLGFYSKPEATLENCLKNYTFTFEKGKENVFYIIIPEKIARTITKFSATEIDTENTFLLEQMPGYSHRYKVTVKEPKGRLYVVIWAPGNGKGQSIWVEEKPARVVLSSLSTSKNHTITARWKKTDADSYQIQIATNSSFTKSTKTYSVKGAETLKMTIKNLKKGKKYYIRVRACNNQRITCYGKWSKYKTIRCK